MFKLASTDEKKQLFSLVHDIWPHDENIDQHVKKRLASVQHCEANWFVIKRNNHVIAGLGKYDLIFTSTNQSNIKAIALGAIYTKKEYRKKGIAKELIEKVHLHAKENKVGISFLYSDIDPNYYKRFGYKSIPSNYFQIISQNFEDDKNLSIKQGSSLTERKKIHKTFLKNFNHYIYRSDKYWSWIQRRFEQAMHFNCFISSKLCGYITLDFYENRIQLLDYGFLHMNNIKNLKAFVIKALIHMNKESCFTWENYFSSEQKNIIQHKRTKEIPMYLTLDSNVSINDHKNFLLYPIDHV